MVTPRRLFISTAVSLSFCGAAALEGLQLTLVDSRGAPVAGLAVVFEEGGAPFGAGGESRVRARGVTSEHGVAAIEIPTGVHGAILVSSAAWWAPPFLVDGTPGSGGARLEVWPAGLLTGQLSIPRGASLPKLLAAKIQDAGPVGTQGLRAQVEVPCLLSNVGFRCVLPARALDIELRAAGFASHFFWEEQLASGKESSVGVLALRPGGSIVGWVAVENGTLDPLRCEVRLTSVSDPRQTTARQEERNRFRGQSTKPDAKGFFALGGMPPGDYRLEVEHPGYAIETAFPIPIVGAGQTKLPNPILLKRPLEVEILIAPALDPLSDPWSVTLAKSTVPAGQLTPIASGQADFVGSFAVPGLAPGTYLLKVETAAGAVFFGREVEIDSDSRIVPVTLEFARVRGHLLVDDRPVRGTLDIGGRQRLPNIRVQTDDDGRFEATLPRWGEWRIDVEVSSLGIETQEKVKIEKPVEGNVANVEIELNDSRLVGWVRDSDGNSVSGARVRIDAAKTIWRTSDEEGRFEVRGLPPGSVQVKASTRDARSRSQVVEIGTDKELHELTLVLEPVDLFGGVVLSEAGPVPGASVTASVRGLPGLDPVETALTDSEGQFELQLTRGGSGVELIVFAPGFTLFAGTFGLGSPGPAVLGLERDSGEVEVAGGWNSNRARAAGIRPYLYFNNASVPVGFLAGWVELNGRNPYASPEALAIPRMPPGSYRLCGVPVQQLVLFGPIVAASGVECSSGELGPGGTLALELRLPAATGTH